VFVDGGGWEALQDEDGDTYYHCSATGEVSWEVPGRAA
jgi:hypothetical protein